MVRQPISVPEQKLSPPEKAPTAGKSNVAVPCRMPAGEGAVCGSAPADAAAMESVAKQIAATSAAIVARARRGHDAPLPMITARAARSLSALRLRGMRRHLSWRIGCPPFVTGALSQRDAASD